MSSVDAWACCGGRTVGASISLLCRSARQECGVICGTESDAARVHVVAEPCDAVQPTQSIRGRSEACDGRHVGRCARRCIVECGVQERFSTLLKLSCRTGYRECRRLVAIAQSGQEPVHLANKLLQCGELFDGLTHCVWRVLKPAHDLIIHIACALERHLGRVKIERHRLQQRCLCIA
eukprot:498690-Prymnesium_polylepis.1